MTVLVFLSVSAVFLVLGERGLERRPVYDRGAADWLRKASHSQKADFLIDPLYILKAHSLTIPAAADISISH